MKGTSSDGAKNLFVFSCQQVSMHKLQKKIANIYLIMKINKVFNF